MKSGERNERNKFEKGNRWFILGVGLYMLLILDLLLFRIEEWPYYSGGGSEEILLTRSLFFVQKASHCLSIIPNTAGFLLLNVLPSFVAYHLRRILEIYHSTKKIRIATISCFASLNPLILFVLLSKYVDSQPYESYRKADIRSHQYQELAVNIVLWLFIPSLLLLFYYIGYSGKSPTRSINNTSTRPNTVSKTDVFFIKGLNNPSIDPSFNLTLIILFCFNFIGFGLTYPIFCS